MTGRSGDGHVYRNSVHPSRAKLAETLANLLGGARQACVVWVRYVVADKCGGRLGQTIDLGLVRAEQQE
jgi:hypothetical protein